MPVTLANWSRRRTAPEALWPSSAEFREDAILFTSVAAGIISFNLIGQLPAGEILVLAVLPFIRRQARERAFLPEYRWFWLLLFGWLIGTIYGDLANGMPFANQMKGLARVGFFGLDFVFVATLINRKTRGMVVFALGVAAFMLLTALGGNLDATSWKFGGSQGITILALLASSYFYSKRRYLVCAAIFLALAAANLAMAFRSPLAFDLMAMVITLPIGVKGPSASRLRAAPIGDYLRIAILFIGAGGAAFGASRVIKYATDHNFFAEGVTLKFESQSEGKLGMLVGGRPETLVAVQAIKDRPILGHGSFGEDPKYEIMLADIKYEYEYTDSDEPEEYNAIPTHSHLTLAWVENGILGGIFWIFVFALTIRGLAVLMRLRPPLTPFYAYFLLNFLWDILYSPFGSYNRIIGAYSCLICFDLIARAKEMGPAPRSPLRAFSRIRPQPGAIFRPGWQLPPRRLSQNLRGRP